MCFTIRFRFKWRALIAHRRSVGSASAVPVECMASGGVKAYMTAEATIHRIQHSIQYTEHRHSARMPPSFSDIRYSNHSTYISPSAAGPCCRQRRSPGRRWARPERAGQDQWSAQHRHWSSYADHQICLRSRVAGGGVVREKFVRCYFEHAFLCIVTQSRLIHLRRKLLHTFD